MLPLLCVVLIAIVAYAFARPWLRQQPAFNGIYDALEPVEAKLWAKSRTVLLARLTWLGGIVAAIANYTAGVDWPSVLGQLVSHLPAGVQPLAGPLIVPLAVSVLGGAFDWLRHVTTEPLDAKE